jgi:hypothetical protein
LPLIDKTLVQLAKAKVYTKLDIRQAFYYIYINLNLEELIMFYARYKSYKCKVL